MVECALFDKETIELISPAQEITAYEALWEKHRSVKKMADLFRNYEHQLPSLVAQKDGITSEQIKQFRKLIGSYLPFHKYSALFYEDFEYPSRLKDAENPVEILYFRGVLDLLASRSVAIVGARKATEEGKLRARKLAKMLVEKRFVVMSGLAAGIDTCAHEEALKQGGRTIAVIGTPLNKNYPSQNKDLQEKIASEHLLVSQVPFYRNTISNPKYNRFFFPERNKTMSALSEATVIIEASETSGTLTQARAAIAQGRKLFILNSCFEKGLKWPEKFLRKGAIKVVDGSEIFEHLDPIKSDQRNFSSSVSDDEKLDQLKLF